MKCWFGSVPSWISRLIACMGGCLGSCNKPPLVTSVDEPSNGLKIQGQQVKKRNLADDSWASNSGDIDNTSFPSHRSMSSINTSNQTGDTCSSSGAGSNVAEHVNQGLILWNQIRQQWVGNKKLGNKERLVERKLSWNATYESLLGTNKPFPQPIPLREMVNFLVDVWEQEGLYD